MNKRKLLLMTGTVFLAIALSACSGSNTSDPAMNPGMNESPAANDANNAADDASSAPAGNAEELEPAGKATPDDTANSTLPADDGDDAVNSILPADDGADDAAAQPLPATKTFELELEGMKEEKTAQLAEGDGYALYVFDIFNFDAAAGKLSMDFNENYHVEIAKLPPDYNLDDLKATAEAELSELGEVRELKGGDVHPLMQDAKLVLKAGTDNLFRQYIVKEVGGGAYAFKVNKPQGEAGDGFETHAFLSLNSIVTQ